MARVDLAIGQRPYALCPSLGEDGVHHDTISVGFTDLRPGDTPSSAVERADKAVYHAKHHGRDQVCSHSVLVSEGLVAPDNRDSDVEFF